MRPPLGGVPIGKGYPGMEGEGVRGTPCGTPCGTACPLMWRSSSSTVIARLREAPISLSISSTVLARGRLDDIGLPALTIEGSWKQRGQDQAWEMNVWGHVAWLQWQRRYSPNVHSLFYRDCSKLLTCPCCLRTWKGGIWERGF